MFPFPCWGGVLVRPRYSAQVLSRACDRPDKDPRPMRRLAASSALAAAVAAGFAGTRAFVAPAQPHLEKATRNSRLDHVSFGWIVRARSSSSPDTLLLLLQQGQQEERRQGGQKEEREAYAGQDDQRRFWDTVVKVRSCIFIVRNMMIVYASKLLRVLCT